METSVVNAKGQLLIPKWILNKYGIKPGAWIILEETDKGVLIKPMNEPFFNSFAGILKSDGDFKEEWKKYKKEEKHLEEEKMKRILEL